MKSVILLLVTIFASQATYAIDVAILSSALRSEELQQILGRAKVDEVKILNETKSADERGSLTKISITYYPMVKKGASEGPGICNTQIAYTHYPYNTGFDVGYPMNSIVIEQTNCWQ